MKWFRSRAKYGATLALLALAIQFALSFGHFHSDAAQAAPGIHAIAATVTPATDSPPASQNATVDGKQAQRGPDQTPAPHHDDYCAICAVMALAGSVITTEPPVLLLPQAYHFLALTTDAEFSHLASPHGIFQPRAPPAS